MSAGKDTQAAGTTNYRAPKGRSLLSAALRSEKVMSYTTRRCEDIQKELGPEGRRVNKNKLREKKKLRARALLKR